ncbi:MAG: hypothetical protein KatS3mg115_2638 [Candidatus Poribacteria bacterium]|nr:MAG: hypothetical protein KatS3mg115_2638 [Candidatus Poribacteria bacterium]
MRGPLTGVRAVAFFNELPSGKIKVSLRSRWDPLRVDEIARRFGGGGHPYAAGCLLEPPVEEVERRVVAALEQALHQLDAGADGRRS